MVKNIFGGGIMKPRVNLLYVPGTNCHHETIFAFKLVGGDPKLVLLNRVLSGKERLDKCDLFCLSGGFGWGDHIRAGWVEALDLVHRLRDQLTSMLEKQIPMLGICNGFQVLAATGLLDGKLGQPFLLLDQNTSARFEHWKGIKIIIHHQPGCIWTEGLDGIEMTLPVAHAEGRPVFLRDIDEHHQWSIAATYGTDDGVDIYPVSPNGSKIAAISNEVIMGLMPHPERRVDKGRHGGDEGLLIFQNGVKAVK
jgi:phosphoribosylformylglycinamidine synthase